MTPAENLPAWAALSTAVLVLLGAALTLVGAIGTLRFGSFFERVHAPTLGTSWGTGAILLASVVCFSALGSRPIVHEIMIGVFVTITTPVTLMLLARAALYRDRVEDDANVPPRTMLRRRSVNAAAPESGDEQPRG
ncbi:multisubunit potassium/proton antiporter PhaG subunit [Bosea sp. AK1]|uniref:monovalent cation/H(+) antiporter subunit G n=1 Tax=Bosea sp. AK1 TaxID=2587160 RepID=UPI001154A41A|nr:monovalent cation/H(+) antiporter subunit G [Bosea sp. AK1]TQI73675.1 multisubunit potassium/proton antiporter PhaG subunit [Bosea sp. AK1]